MEFIQGSEKLISIFGHWPSFHDAEVHWIKAERGSVDHISISMAVQVWDYGPEVDERGYFKTFSHTLAELRFSECEDLEISLDKFNHQNVLSCIEIERREDGKMDVLLESIFGIGGKLKCRYIEVLNAEAYSDPRFN